MHCGSANFAELLNLGWCITSLAIKPQNDWRDIGGGPVSSCNASQ